MSPLSGNPPLVEFEETDPSCTEDHSVNRQGIDPRWVELVEAVREPREATGKTKEIPCHGHKSHITRAGKLFMRDPDYWATQLDAVASLPNDPWQETQDALRQRYMRRFGLISGEAGPEEVETA